jgi:hypothetical protein
MERAGRRNEPCRAGGVIFHRTTQHENTNMAILTGKYDPNAEASQDIGKLPTGEYIAQIIDSDMKPTNNNQGEYLELTYEVLDGPCKGRKHWERLNLISNNETASEIANRNWAAVRQVTVNGREVRDSQEVHNKPHVIRIENFPAGSVITYGAKKGQKREREEAQIKAWKAVEGGAGNAPAAANAAPATNASPSSAPWAKKNAA